MFHFVVSKCYIVVIKVYDVHNKDLQAPSEIKYGRRFRAKNCNFCTLLVRLERSLGGTLPRTRKVFIAHFIPLPHFIRVTGEIASALFS